MLAHPGQSVVVMLNPSRYLTVAEPVIAGERRTSLRRLALGCRILDVSSLVVGDFDPQELSAIVPNGFQMVPADGLLPWDDQRFLERMSRDDLRFLFLAGAWLEEEVLLAALEAAQRGYDVRLLSDLSSARHEAERRPVFDRLALHGMVVTTVRQTLLELVVSRGDERLKQEIRSLLE